MRIDLFLYKKGYAKSRSNAKVLLESGAVYLDGIQIKKPSFELSEDAEIEIKGEICPFVSRGGLKLRKALDEFDIDVGELVCLDIGASTGGFTDCLLQRGARRVYAVDCGHGQLDSTIADDRRVVSLEGINARQMKDDLIPEKCDICVMDVSFISQTLIHSSILKFLADGALFVTLIKPQFEVGRANIGKNGIVKNERAIKESIDRVCDSASAHGFEKIGICDSPILGGDGNREYIGVFRMKRLI